MYKNKLGGPRREVTGRNTAGTTAKEMKGSSAMRMRELHRGQFSGAFCLPISSWIAFQLRFAAEHMVVLTGAVAAYNAGGGNSSPRPGFFLENNRHDQVVDPPNTRSRFANAFASVMRSSAARLESGTSTACFQKLCMSVYQSAFFSQWKNYNIHYFSFLFYLHFSRTTHVSMQRTSSTSDSFNLRRTCCTEHAAASATSSGGYSDPTNPNFLPGASTTGGKKGAASFLQESVRSGLLQERSKFAAALSRNKYTAQSTGSEALGISLAGEQGPPLAGPFRETGVSILPPTYFKLGTTELFVM